MNPSYSCNNAQETQQWGQRFAAQVHAGDIVVLTGELGAGKTTLTQGIARGLGIHAPVNSPTFTLSRVYPPGERGIGLLHLDVYRLKDLPDIMAQLDALDIEEYQKDCVIIIEWGAAVAQHYVDSWYEITISVTDTGRTIDLVKANLK